MYHMLTVSYAHSKSALSERKSLLSLFASWLHG